MSELRPSTFQSKLSAMNHKLGWQLHLPDTVADSKTGNALLHNRGLREDEEHHSIWLFCTGVGTGYRLTGNTSQSQRSRTFYPRHMSHDDIVIRGITANQKEYNRLVDFVVAHHDRALDAPDSVDSGGEALRGTRPIRFSLKPYRIKTREGGPWMTIHPAMGIEGYITGITAGAERFQQAVPFELTLKVTDEMLGKEQSTVELIEILSKPLPGLVGSYMNRFRPYYTPGDAPPMEEITAVDKGLSAIKDFWSDSALADQIRDVTDAATDFVDNLFGDD